MEIGRLKCEEIAKVIKLYRELVEEDSKIEVATEIYKEMMENPNYLLAVAREDNEIVGTMEAIVCKSLSMNGKNFLVIEDVVVSKECRGKGVGKELVKYIDNFAKENNCAYAILASSGFRKGAHKFYEATGFTDDVRGFRKLYND